MFVLFLLYIFICTAAAIADEKKRNILLLRTSGLRARFDLAVVTAGGREECEN